MFAELKLKALELYNNKLDERVRLRRFILDNNLLDYKKTQQLERRRTKEDRELYSNMRVFLQLFASRKEYHSYTPIPIDFFDCTVTTIC